MRTVDLHRFAVVEVKHLQYTKLEMKENGDSRHTHIKLLLSLCVSDRAVSVSGETTVRPFEPCASGCHVK